MLAFWLCSCVDSTGRGDYVIQTAVNYIIEIEGELDGVYMERDGTCHMRAVSA
jgi:hypothetical protein